MKLTMERTHGKVVLHLEEERLDAHNAGGLKDHVLEVLESGDLHLIIDLGRVRFVDSSGLGALLSGHKNAALRRGTLALANLQPQVQSMFELTRLHRVFKIHDNLAEALNVRGPS